ncbi:hiamine-pyrophosphate-requiring enzyme [Hyaloraphidium curvatum]|nr:hiamine-pyrophosphate-requiring enzyme [Hyaloraphidium curvatum]
MNGNHANGKTEMNGADALIATLVANGVTACFANPGTSEMQFVSALDREPRMRGVLCLFEGVCTGAADGFARMAGTPACTLLHLGPGLANASANLHNARRAFSPIVNVVGDHATYHRKHDAPLNSDIAALAKPNSIWIKSADAPDDVGPATAECILASYGPPGGVATLILPADAAWLPATKVGGKVEKPAKAKVAADQVQKVAGEIKAAKSPVIFLGTGACEDVGLAAAARLAAAGLRVMNDTFTARQARGAGRYHPEKLPYFGEQALDALGPTDLMVFVETVQPVAFFAYPNRPSVLVPEGCATTTLASRGQDGVAALHTLADLLGAPKSGPVEQLSLPASPPTGKLDPAACAVSIARHMPENAIICDDAVTSGAPIYALTKTARPHDWILVTGGAIGQAIPLCIGAAVACPERKVLSLNGDGAAMYTVQGLWTIARENLDVTVVVFANHSYKILNIELARTGAGPAGPTAKKLLDLDEPKIDWVSLAKGLGMPAVRCETGESFEAEMENAMKGKGPFFIEAAI